MEKKQKIDQTRKARVGAIGENMVVAKLMQQGWDAFNANGNQEHLLYRSRRVYRTIFLRASAYKKHSTKTICSRW